MPLRMGEIMNARSWPAVFLLVVLGGSGLAYGWNGRGHMLVACVAWDRLKQDEQQACIGILKEHPLYRVHFKDQIPNSVKAEDIDRWMFAHAATWPDVVRSGRYSSYHRAYWHFINSPVYLGPQHEAWLRNRLPVNLEERFNESSGDEEDLNALQAMEKQLENLQSGTHPKDRAIALCWVLHIVGDLHQPLHTSALFSKNTFAGGDHGGNYIKLLNESGGEGKNLHSTWDGLLGKSTNLAGIKSQIHEQLQDGDIVNAAESAARELEAAKWVKEGNRLCREFVYDDEILEAVREADEDGDRHPQAVSLPDDYFKQAKKIAGKRAVIGGFRLAEVLRTTLNEK